MSKRGLSRTVMALGFVLAAQALIACGDGDDQDQRTTQSPAITEDEGPPEGAEIDISNVPELQDGVLTVGSDIAYEPMEFYQEGSQDEMGVDVDIARAMGELLGVEVKFQQTPKSEIIDPLKAGGSDIIMSAISITPESEAEIDFIPYFGPAGTGMLVPFSNPEGIVTLEDLCGRSVSAQVGTTQVDYMNQLNESECKDNPIDIKTFPDKPTAVQELASGRVDAELADDPVAAYSALESDGDLELATVGFDSELYGIGVRKDSPELKRVLEAALGQIISDGTYEDILADWGQDAFGIE